MARGLIDTDPTGTDGYAVTTTGGNQQTRSPVGFGPAPAMASTADRSAESQMAGAPAQVATMGPGQSHLDTVFASSGWTREDVLVLAALLQLGMWLALLYIELNDG